MPGPSPAAAVNAFLKPLKDAASCIGGAHFELTPRALGEVGQTHSWTFQPIRVAKGLSFSASMWFETLDLGRSEKRNRYRVTTRAYMYAVSAQGHEIISAHWHPTSTSSVTTPHWHIGAKALTDEGVYLERAHIPSPRISFEQMIRFMIEQIQVEPHRKDWSKALARTESVFETYKSW